MTTPLTLGAVPYLNAWPLTRELERRPEAFTIVRRPPAELAEMLWNGEMAAATVPVGAFLAMEDARYVPGVCIASNGPAESVRLFLRKPVAQVRRVCLDAASRSSNMLARVLMTVRFRLEPDYLSVDPREGVPEEADAWVVIGDEALRLAARGAPSVDLGEAWKELTGLPFVFAVWGVMPGTDLRGAEKDLQSAALAGVREAPSLADEAARTLGLPREDLLRYLTKTMVYRLGEAELAGLRAFRDLAARHGLLSKGMAITPYAAPQ